MYVQNIIQPVMLPLLLQQQGNILFQQDNTCPSVARANQCAQARYLKTSLANMIVIPVPIKQVLDMIG